jgi:hypothetical protein
MWWNQTFLFLASLCVHSGFGLTLGYFVDHLRRRSSSRLMLLATLLFSLFIYIPSTILIASLSQLAIHGRMMILLAGLISVVLPNIPRFRRDLPINSRWLMRVYPAVTMLLLAAWSFILLAIEGSASGAPLALSSSIAGISALTQRS